MSDPRTARRLSEWQLRWMFNLYPPFWLGRIRVLEVGSRFRSCRVRIARSIVTRNVNGSTFGGTLYSAVDPIYPILFWQIFAHRGRRLQVWTRGATIRFLRPAAGPVEFEARLTDEEIEHAARAIEDEGRFEREFPIEVLDRQERTCVRAEVQVTLRAS